MLPEQMADVLKYMETVKTLPEFQEHIAQQIAEVFRIAPELMEPPASREPEIYADRQYDKFRVQILKKATEPAIICPFCGDGFPENCDYVDIGVGQQQSTPNVCEECGAYEQGAYDRSPDTHDFKDGWCRAKKELNTGAPGPHWNPDDNPLDFFGDL